MKVSPGKYAGLLGLLLACVPAWSCEMTMGYRTNAKPPLIAGAPDNEGLYTELFRQALGRIQCSLVIVRAPKGRVLQGLRDGGVDFYPGLNFTGERAGYVQFLPNGLVDGYIGLTRREEPEIRSLREVADRDLVMVASYGGYDMDAERYGIDVRRPHDYSLKQLAQLILDGRADFHAYNLLAVRYFLMSNPQMAARLRTHPDCCGVNEPMYMAFSKNSGHISLQDNPAFRPAAPLSADNVPQQVAPRSRAYLLSQALLEMQRDGTIDALYRKYFGSWDN